MFCTNYNKIIYIDNTIIFISSDNLWDYFSYKAFPIIREANYNIGIVENIIWWSKKYKREYSENLIIDEIFFIIDTLMIK